MTTSSWLILIALILVAIAIINFALMPPLVPPQTNGGKGWTPSNGINIGEALEYYFPDTTEKMDIVYSYDSFKPVESFNPSKGISVSEILDIVNAKAKEKQ